MEFDEKVGRVIRQDGLEEQGKLTYEFIAEAIREGRREDALKLLEYLELEHRLRFTSLYTVIQRMETYLADNLGEEHIGRFWRYMVAKGKGSKPVKRKAQWLPKTAKGWTMRELVETGSEVERGLFTEQDLVEDDEKVVRILKVCGGCGRMRQEGEELGTTKKAYTWSWGKKGVPYHCTHRAIMLESARYENNRLPQLHEWSTNPNEPCRQIMYKDPRKAVEVYRERLQKMLDEGLIEDKEEARRLLKKEFKFEGDEFTRP